MLAYARAGRRALRRVPWPNIPPIKASITLYCHRSCIHATRFPTHCKQETTQKNACRPPPKPGDAAFGVLPSPAFGNCMRAAHRQPRGNEKASSFIYATRFSTHCQPETRACKQMKTSAKARQRLSVHRPNQRLRTHWGRYTAAPNVIKTMHFNQSFAVFHTLPTRYDVEKCMDTSTKAKRRFGASPGLAFGNSLGAVHCHERCS